MGLLHLWSSSIFGLQRVLERTQSKLMFFTYTDFTWQYTIKLDPRGEKDLRFRCKHVNFVENTHFANEREFLFSPYSVFDVEMVKWSDNCNYMRPHEITLRCAESQLVSWGSCGDVRRGRVAG
jgi:hypothetical protein